ncbi:MAG: sigma-E factor negative regulatory protein [Pseudoxanthomonas sp.]
MTDKFEQHYSQQLSELMDGELAPDQARFLLRRLEHDDDLRGSLERWQLCGDVLRGQVVRTASVDFAAHVAAAVTRDAAAPTGRRAARPRTGLLRWGGGALAASVALLALLVARQLPDASETPATGAGTLAEVESTPAAAQAPAVATVADAASSQPLAPPSVPSTPSTPAPSAAATAAAGVAVASIGPRQARNPERRGSATRSQQAARVAQQRSQMPQLASAGAPVALPPLHRLSSEEAVAGHDPFAGGMDAPASRPWPRSVLPQYANSPYTASFGGSSNNAGFYPFEPQLREVPATPAGMQPGDPSP